LERLNDTPLISGNVETVKVLIVTNLDFNV